ncbi:virulence factor MviM [Synergistales bacterium]|nr:virulence factor MviM [Synergistales bacterium]
MEKKIRIGIIGAGSIAKTAHLPSFSSFADVEIVTILSRTFEKAVELGAQYAVKHVARTLDEFLQQDLDAALLLTPKTVRSEYLVPLLDAGLDIFLEKPMATTLKEARALADVATKSGRIVMVAFNRRYSPINQRGIEVFGGIKPHYVLASKSREFKEYRATLENSIHMVDMLRYILGECVKVDAAAVWHGDPFYEDLCTAMLTFEGGNMALLGASREAGQWYERVEMFGGNKTVIMESPSSYSVIYPDREEHFNMSTLHKGWANMIDMIGFRPCARHFIDCVKTRQKPLTTAEDALKTHELMDQILRAAGLPDLSEDWSEKAK